MAMIDELLFIKEFRERKAETELQKSRARLSAAVQAEQEAKATLERFIEHATAEELRMFADLCSRVVKLRDINDVHSEVAALKYKEQAHQQELEGRQKQHVQARDDFDGSTRKMREASTAREKFVELARNFHWLAAREAERKEELELEELASVVREREEWGGEQS
jgi:type III secretion protein O